MCSPCQLQLANRQPARHKNISFRHKKVIENAALIYLTAYEFDKVKLLLFVIRWGQNRNKMREVYNGIKTQTF